jgi:hypothetical protein
MKLNDPGGGGELLALYGREALVAAVLFQEDGAPQRPYLWQRSEVDFRSPGLCWLSLDYSSRFVIEFW